MSAKKCATRLVCGVIVSMLSAFRCNIGKYAILGLHFLKRTQKMAQHIYRHGFYDQISRQYVGAWDTYGAHRVGFRSPNVPHPCAVLGK